MTRQFILRARAEHDIRSALEWNESQRAGLGAEFLAALRERLEAVRSHPEANPVLYRGIRRAVLSRFPYLIFYIARPERVAVLAAFHHARNPAVWPRR
jgi:plasmid stabilization system protein ParE